MKGSGAGPEQPIRIAVAGAGTVGMTVIEALDAGIHGCQLSVVALRDVASGTPRLAHLRTQVPIVGIADLEPLADVVVECAPSALFTQIAEPFLRAGKAVIALSAGAILTNEHLLDLAHQHGGQIIVPTGALLGLDAVTAAAEGEISSVRMVTRKPVRGLVGAPFLIENDIRIEDAAEPVMVFKGSPRDAATGFPANLNVAVALSLAGIGPDRTTLEIWADPHLERNCHRIDVESDSACFSLEIENIPTENPKTGRITALSVIACLRKFRAPLRVGT